jgi:hypothetical protein
LLLLAMWFLFYTSCVLGGAAFNKIAITYQKKFPANLSLTPPPIKDDKPEI